MIPTTFCRYRAYQSDSNRHSYAVMLKSDWDGFRILPLLAFEWCEKINQREWFNELAPVFLPLQDFDVEIVRDGVPSSVPADSEWLWSLPVSKDTFHDWIHYFDHFFFLKNEEPYERACMTHALTSSILNPTVLSSIEKALLTHIPSLRIRYYLKGGFLSH